MNNVGAFMIYAQAQAVAAPYRARLKPTLDRIAAFRFSDPTLNAGAANVLRMLRIPLALPAANVCASLQAWEQSGFAPAIPGLPAQVAVDRPLDPSAHTMLRLRNRLVQIGMPFNEALVFGTVDPIADLGLFTVGAQWTPGPHSPLIAPVP